MKKGLDIEIVKAAGKARREEEIKLHGKQIFFTMGKISENKKTYNRKKKHKKEDYD